MLFHTEAIFIKSHAIYYGFGVLGNPKHRYLAKIGEGLNRKDIP